MYRFNTKVKIGNSFSKFNEIDIRRLATKNIEKSSNRENDIEYNESLEKISELDKEKVKLDIEIKYLENTIKPGIEEYYDFFGNLSSIDIQGTKISPKDFIFHNSRKRQFDNNLKEIKKKRSEINKKLKAQIIILNNLKEIKNIENENVDKEIFKTLYDN
jgi:hypothetical protein